MPTLSLTRDGADTPVPLGDYAGTLITELHDTIGAGVSVRQITTQVTAPHTLGSLAAGLTTLLHVPGAVVDLAITSR
ncbi:hypothetical protein OG455_41335 [Kitasatospora sp. NBC_01287]|uniref:hypothetical protein n=1 Tax=Kitasatospora sp. NBC_01287 TaxID=2903573 RepID=UPI00224F8BD7|nr:hypothetical protein [Kitasatospora sp. NBC_01287]MCX4750927.1 hypothetical protein [Kitasatospora sp. NBC_01287]MCX4751822.1 hypothetical protein [Kitasatospora sp. NBC_01287]MCX4751886.1 hypothetical protein [Kitasatospora sp. NBC_01287]